MEDQDLSLEDILDEIAAVRMESDVVGFSVDQITDWNKAKALVFPKLVNKADNEELLAERPNVGFAENLAVTYAVEIKDDSIVRNGSKASAPVTNQMLESWGITVEELDRTARENINGKGQFKTMREVLIEMMGGNVPEFMLPPEEEDPSMFVLSNDDKINGAAALLDDGMLEDISNRLGGDFTILPSSIHEVIILPQNISQSRNELRDMVVDVNSTQVAPEERLSDNVYRYDSVTKQVVLAA